MKRLEYVNALRELADFVEGKNLPDEWESHSWSGLVGYPTPTMTFSLYKKGDFGAVAVEWKCPDSFIKLKDENLLQE